MKVYLCFVFVSSVFGELVLHETLYTVLTGIEKQPDCIVLSFVGDLQIDYYNSSSRIVEVHELAKPLAPPNYTQQMSNVYSSECTRMKTQLTDIMERFEHRSGPHMFQRKLGCKWDDVTGSSEGLDEYRYDGQQFTVLRVENDSYSYIHLLQEASDFAEVLNNNPLLKELKEYYKYECSNWAKRMTSHEINEKPVPPKISLFQSSPSSPLGCLATGFYPKELTMTWKNGNQEIREGVGKGETLPNGDGTFQKRIYLNVGTEKLKNNQYRCVVQQKYHTYIESEIQTNHYDFKALYFGIPVGWMIIVSAVGACSCLFVKGRKVLQRRKKDYCPLTLDPNTAHPNLRLSEKNRVVTYSDTVQCYSDYPERFDGWLQVMCKESVSGRCYWEVEWSNEGGSVSISVSYKGIRRKGGINDCWFGWNSQSWSLQCSPSSLSFWHNTIWTEISGPPSSRIGVYVDHSAGTLSFYNVSHTVTLLHTVHTTFTQPLYAGFYVVYGTVRLCDKE